MNIGKSFSSNIWYRFANVSIRLSTLGLKYIFFATLPIFFSFEEVGKYNLINASITLLIYILGMEFYYYANRKMLHSILDSDSKSKASAVISSQFALYAINHVLLSLPIIAWFEYKYDIGVISLIFIVFYHINMELSRILIHLNKQLQSSIVLGICQGLWVIAAWIFIMAGCDIDIEKLLLINIVFMIAGVAYGTYLIKHLLVFSIASVNPREIKEGLHVTLPLTAGVLGFKASEFLGRFWLESAYSMEAAGIFSYYQNISFAIQEIVYTGVIAIYLPHLIKYREKNKQLFDSYLKKAHRDTILLAITIATIVLIASKYIFLYLGKIELTDNFSSLILITASYCTISIASFYGLIMYIYKRDKATAAINIICAFVAVLSMAILINTLELGVQGASIAFLGWAVLQLASKYYYTKNHILADR